MPRFHFELVGSERVADPQGSQFGNALEAFKAATRLAREIADVRPNLRGNTCVIMTNRDRPEDLYCVSIE